MEKTRRDVLKLMGAAAGTALLAACNTNLSDKPGLSAQGDGDYQQRFVDARSGDDGRDENGEPTNQGTDVKKPLKTLQRALDLSERADAVPKISLRAGGTYSVGVIRKYGTPATPMMIDRWDEGDTPVISGGLTITDWEKDPNRSNVYKGGGNNRFYSLYIDGEEAPVSTFASRWLSIKDYDHEAGEITLEGALVNSSVVGARVRVRVTKYAEQADRQVKAVRGDTLVLDAPLNQPLKFYDKALGRYRQQLKLENGKGDAFLDGAGDWCCVKEDGGYATYLYSSRNPNDKTVEGAVHEDLLTLAETSGGSAPEYLNINNVKFVMAGRNALTSAVGARNIRVGNGCAFSRINKAGIYFYDAASAAENITIGDNLSNPDDLNRYMQFDRCGIMVFLNNPLKPTIRFLRGKEIGLTGAAFNDREERGVLSQLNGAVITSGYWFGRRGNKPNYPDEPPKAVRGSIHHIHLTDIGANGIAHNGFGTTISDITGDGINQRLDDVALVYCWSRANGSQVRRTENVTITSVTARNSSDVYQDEDGRWEGWDYANPDLEETEQAERLRVGVYIDNGVKNSVVEAVTAKACFKGVLVNYFTRNITVRSSTVTDCEQGVVIHERPSDKTLSTGHVIDSNTVRPQEDQYAFVF